MVTGLSYLSYMLDTHRSRFYNDLHVIYICVYQWSRVCHIYRTCHCVYLLRFGTIPVRNTVSIITPISPLIFCLSVSRETPFSGHISCSFLPGVPFLLTLSLLWRHNEYDGVSNHHRLDCLLNRSFRRRSKKTSKLRVTGLCEGNPPATGGFPSQRTSNAKNVSFDDVIMMQLRLWHGLIITCTLLVECNKSAMPQVVNTPNFNESQLNRCWS